MAIKKQFTELHAFLEANKNRKVSTILDELTEMMSGSARADKTFIKDADGNITHIYCYYHKVWEALDEHAYGLKKNSTTGYNTMCKAGVNQWSKQQRVAKQAKELVLEQVASGELNAGDIKAKLDEIESARTEIVFTDDYVKSAQPE